MLDVEFVSVKKWVQLGIVHHLTRREVPSLQGGRIWILGYHHHFVGGSSGSSSMSRGEMSLADVQCHLDKEGASNLVIDLIMNATSDRVFHESILLAIALLEGGNTTIQVGKWKVLIFWLKRVGKGNVFEIQETWGGLSNGRGND